MKIAMMLCLLVLAAESSWAAFDDYQRFRKGTYDFEFETHYFKTEANYTESGGSYQKLLSGQSYELFNFLLKTRYDLSKRSTLYGSLNLANATSNGLTMNRSNSTVTGAILGYGHRVYDQGFDLIADFYTLIPFQKIDQNTDTVINSEGVIEATGLLRAQMDFTTFSALGYVGLTYRQARSALLPWGAGIEANYAKWGWGGKIFGFQSITNDPDTSDRIPRTIVTDRVDASSLVFYSVNPSLIDSEVFARFKFDNVWALTVGGGSTITGTSTAAGYHAGVSLKYSWDSEPSYYMKNPGAATQEDNLSSERKVPRFKEEIDDGVNQKLFQKKGTTPPPAPTPRSGGDMTPAAENVAVRKVGPQPTPSQVQETSNGGEVQLKLKKKRKKRSAG